MHFIKRYMKYTFLNILGQIGISCYILADTYFIAKSRGLDGVAALNLVLPIYGVIFAVGYMLGVGSAIGYAIDADKGRRETWFSHAILMAILIGVFFAIFGILFAKDLLKLMGADAYIASVGLNYTRIFLGFTLFFMLNPIFNAFVRNDGAPILATVATLSSNLFNIIFDYIFMFPLGMGMEGAALATAISPIVGVSICLLHFRKQKSNLIFRFVIPEWKKLVLSAKLGFSAFIGQISSGIIILVFNYLILDITGNIGVAAYGVIANISIVVGALFNGIAQGSQPLASEYIKEESSLGKIQKIGICNALLFALLIYVYIYFHEENLIAMFNAERNEEFIRIASEGMKIYFIGFFIAGINIFLADFYSAIGRVREAFLISISRGLLAISVFAIILSNLFSMKGIWISFFVAEVFTILLLYVMKKMVYDKSDKIIHRKML